MSAYAIMVEHTLRSTDHYTLVYHDDMRYIISVAFTMPWQTCITYTYHRNVLLYKCLIANRPAIANHVKQPL
jgi:hypothetical protein